MKTSVYLLEKDFGIIDSVKKRFLIETVCELKGASNDAGVSYAEIQSVKPEILIFSYPMNFTAEQLVTAMSNVNQKMHYIALVEPGYESSAMELRQVGISDIFQKPFDLDGLMDTVRRVATMNSNPFGQQPQNPFGQQTNSNPFGGNPQQNPQQTPFGGSVQQPFGGNPQQQVPFSQQPMGGTSQQPNVNSFQQPNYNTIGGPNANGGQFGMPTVGGQEYMGNGQTFKTIRQNLIALHCPKGGVGKTSVSTNVATLLSTVKIGKQPLKVLLVDMDWAFGDVCVNLGLQPRPNIMSWVNDIKARRSLNESADMNFTEAQIDKYLITYKTGLKILAAPSSHNDMLDIPDDTAKIVIDNLKNNCNFDVILFDCGNNTDTHTLQALLSVHSVYEVITMDISAMNDLSMLMSTLKSISFPVNKMKLIVNKLPKADREFAIEDISNAIGLEVASVIPENEKVRVHNNNGEPLVLSKTTNSFTEAIKQTSNTMLGNNLFSKKGVRQEQQSGGSFFSKLFGKK